MRFVKLLQALVAVAALSHVCATMAQSDPWAASYRLEKSGQYADAFAAIAPLLAREPGNEFAVMRSAWLLYLQGKHAEAENRYQRAAQLNSHSMEAVLGMMLAQMGQYRWADAMKAGRKVLEQSRWDYTAHVRIMICEEAMSRWGELAKHASDVAARYPTDATVLVYWARAEAALRNTSKARKLYGQVLERIPEHLEAIKYVRSSP